MAAPPRRVNGDYSLADTLLNVVLSFDPVDCSAETLASAINDAISAYSTAVAPRVSRRMAVRKRMISSSLGRCPGSLAGCP